MEYVDVYDEALVYLGKLPKKDVHKTGDWHKSIHCWIVREDDYGKYLLFQKRSNTKKSFANYLDITAAGHYQAGEEIEDGIREITEELGIKVKYSDLYHLGMKFDIYKDEKIFNREFCEVFLYQDNRPLNEYSIDCDEVTGLVQIKIQDGLELFSQKTNEIEVSGIELNESTNNIEKIEMVISKESVIPRIDPYYGKIFMLSKAFLEGERPLFI